MNLQNCKIILSVLLLILILEVTSALPSKSSTRKTHRVEVATPQKSSTLTNRTVTIPTESESENETFTSSEESLSNMFTNFIRELFHGSQDQNDEEFLLEKSSHPHPTPVVSKYRHLTPIDLTEPFAFDDAEEIATANETMLNNEELKDMDSIIKELNYYHNIKNISATTPSPIVTKHTTFPFQIKPIQDAVETVRHEIGEIGKSLSHISGFLYKPIRVRHYIIIQI